MVAWHVLLSVCSTRCLTFACLSGFGCVATVALSPADGGVSMGWVMRDSDLTQTSHAAAFAVVLSRIVWLSLGPHTSALSPCLWCWVSIDERRVLRERWNVVRWHFNIIDSYWNPVQEFLHDYSIEFPTDYIFKVRQKHVLGTNVCLAAADSVDVAPSSHVSRDTGIRLAFWRRVSRCIFRCLLYENVSCARCRSPRTRQSCGDVPLPCST
jgi:hypothetical protein